MKDILEALRELGETRIPTLLIIVGAGFLLLFFVGRFGKEGFEPIRERQKWAAAAGALLLMFGIGLSIIPPARSQPSTEQEQAPAPSVKIKTPRLKPGEVTLLKFTSGQNSEAGRQIVEIQTEQLGKYSLELENANNTFSGHWLIWDYIALKSDNRTIWEVGEDETPTDYSPDASSEFCDPRTEKRCTTEFIVGATKNADFGKELNDGALPMAKIIFTLTEQQAKKNLTVTLSTLYSTHSGTENFQMRVGLKKL